MLLDNRIYKNKDNSVRIKVIFASCDPSFAAHALITKGNEKLPRGKYVNCFNMTGFTLVPARKKAV
jgi:hypothetical protein